MTQYYGKYRGKVVANVDPMRMGRVLIACPHVLGIATNWAMPCLPFAGPTEGFFVLPMPGSNVWVEFEQGDPNRPIWTGQFWDVGVNPLAALPPTTRVHIKTLNTELTLDEALGVKLAITLPVPCTISLGPAGVQVSCGAASVKLDPARVVLNDGALEVI